jgi:hypothetical protein
MKKLYFVLLLLSSIFLFGCSTEKKPEKVADIEYTVVSDSELPKELMELIEEKKEGEFRLTYADGEDLYLVVGYGKKDTSGYSVLVEDFYETEDSLYINTELLGPLEDEKTSSDSSYPWVVVKTSYTDKMIVFD